MKLNNLKQSKTKVERGAFIKVVLFPVALTLIVISIYFFWYQNNLNATDEHIEYIRSFMRSPGVLNDFQNKLGMHNPKEDIKWFEEGDNITIEYGWVILTWTKEDFKTEETLQSLQSIGFTYEIKCKDNNEVIKLYYCGEEIQKWVK